MSLAFGDIDPEFFAPRLSCDPAFDGSTVPLALALAGAWLSNLPLGVIAGYLLAGVALTWAIVNKTWAPLLRAAVATVLGLGLAAIYWLPAALERIGSTSNRPPKIPATTSKTTGSSPETPIRFSRCTT
jgi:hypothetical protein